MTTTLQGIRHTLPSLIFLVGAFIIVALVAGAQPPQPPGPPGGLPSPVASGWTDDGTAVRLTTSTDNVGIGTNAPGAKLDIIGNIKITDGTQGTGKVLTSDTTGLASWQTPTAGGVTGSGAAGFIPKWLAGSTLGDAPMKVDASGNIIIQPSAGRSLFIVTQSNCFEFAPDGMLNISRSLNGCPSL